MSIITYLQLFASYWSDLIQLFLPNSFSYRQFAMIMAFVSSFFIIFELYKSKGKLKQPVLRVIIFMAIITIFYYITPLLYAGVDAPTYYSMRLALVGQMFPAAICACLVSQNKSASDNIKRLSPIVAIVFTALSFVAIFMPNSRTTSGLADNIFGLNYQTASYLAAYSTGFFCYTFITRNSSKHFPFVKNIIFIIGIFVGITINFITILLSGGRGGLAAFLAFVLFSFVCEIIRVRGSINSIIKTILIIICVIVLGAISIRIASGSKLVTSGYSRIITLIQEHDVNGRDSIAINAINSFKSSPLFGHGLGSVFFEMGYYSHNIFLDALIEGGLIELVIVLYILFRTIKKGVYLIKYEYTECLWIFILLCDLVESLFSGYYLSLTSIFWSVAFIYCRYNLMLDDLTTQEDVAMQEESEPQRDSMMSDDSMIDMNSH